MTAVADQRAETIKAPAPFFPKAMEIATRPDYSDQHPFVNQAFGLPRWLHID